MKSNDAEVDTLHKLKVDVCPDIISSTRTSFLKELVPLLAMSVSDLMDTHHDSMRY